MAAPVRPWRHALGVATCCLFGWVAFVRKAQVPLLSLVDLGFHELGHLVARPFPDLIMFMAGSVAQVAVPVGLAAYFLARKDRLAGALCLAWAATSARDVSVYIADAPFQRLELIGGQHDWAFILGGHWDALDKAAPIAAAVRALGIGMLFAGFALCIWFLVMGEEMPAPVSTQPSIIDTSKRRDSLAARNL